MKSIVVGPLHAPFLGTEAQRFLLCLLLFVRQLEGSHFRGACWMVFAQWMSSPSLRHQDSFQVRMTLKTMPNMSQTSRSYQFAAGQRSVAVSKGGWSLLSGNFDAEIFVPIKGQQMIHNGEVACRLALAMHPHPLVNGSEVVQHPVGRSTPPSEIGVHRARSAVRSSTSGFRPQCLAALASFRQDLRRNWSTILVVRDQWLLQTSS